MDQLPKIYAENPEMIRGENQYSPELPPVRSKDQEGDTDMAEENKNNGKDLGYPLEHVKKQHSSPSNKSNKAPVA